MTEAEIARWPEEPLQRAGLLDRAASLILAGEVVAFPTDTVYGIGVHAWNRGAVQRLYAIKERPANKAIALLISGLDQLSQVTDFRSAQLETLAQRYWPGGLTLVVPWRPSSAAGNDRGVATVGIRVPDHPIPLALIAQVGAPLATTSANLSGSPSAITATEVFGQIGARIALILDGGACPGGRDSTVVDLTTDVPTVRRVGAVPIQELETLLGPIAVAS